MELGYISIAALILSVIGLGILFFRPRALSVAPSPDSYDCFILGCGRSLLELGPEEIDHINRSPFILAFNKYILFYEKIGIIPTHYLLADKGPKAHLMFRETTRLCGKDPLRKVQFIFSKELKRKLRKLPESKIFSKSSVKKRTTFITRTNWLKGGDWAHSLKDPIYHYRGSLSGAINITSILNPNQRIKLLGVDLANHEYFFQEEIENDSQKWGIFLERITPDATQHETVVEVSGTAGILEAFPFIEENVQKNGGELLCCNPQSLLVTQRILEHGTVTDE